MREYMRRIWVKWAAVECRPRSFRGLLEVAVKPEYASVTATSVSREYLDEIVPRAAAIPREVNTQRTRDALLRRFFSFFFFYLPTTSPHVTSPFVNGRIPRKVVARIFCMKPPFSLSDRFFVKDVLDFYSYKSLTQFSSFMHLKCLCRFF